MRGVRFSPDWPHRKCSGQDRVGQVDSRVRCRTRLGGPDCRGEELCPAPLFPPRPGHACRGCCRSRRSAQRLTRAARAALRPLAGAAAAAAPARFPPCPGEQGGAAASSSGPGPARRGTAMLACCRPLLRPALRATPLAALHCSARRPAARVAVVLSGCGVYDGTEIHEASAILFHLSRKGAEVQMYAPDVLQMHVIDHTKGQPAEAESRNVLTESARIARGKITNLAKLTTQDHDAVIFPGGFGAAKNLSTFAVDGKDCKVHKEVERVLQEFHKAGKPIGLCCISPVLAAKVLPGAEVTVGHEAEEGGKWPYAGTAGAIKALGAKHCVKEVTEAHVDLKNKVVTTPAFMCETELHHIFEGIGAMVKNVLKLTGKYSGVS